MSGYTHQNNNEKLESAFLIYFLRRSHIIQCNKHDKRVCITVLTHWIYGKIYNDITRVYIRFFGVTYVPILKINKNTNSSMDMKYSSGCYFKAFNVYNEVYGVKYMVKGCPYCVVYFPGTT